MKRKAAQVRRARRIAKRTKRERERADRLAADMSPGRVEGQRPLTTQMLEELLADVRRLNDGPPGLLLLAGMVFDLGRPWKEPTNMDGTPADPDKAKAALDRYLRTVVVD